MNKAIWITRPSQDAGYFENSLKDKGFTSIVEPLLRIKYNKINLETDNIQALIFTSANGVRAYMYNRGRTDLPVYAVGDATGMEAKNSGFETVYISKGDVLFLSETIKEHACSNSGALLHIAGSVIAKDLSALLLAHNYKVNRKVLYEAVERKTLTRTMQETLNDDGITGVILMSPRTARIFKEIIVSHNLHSIIPKLKLYCLSDAVAIQVRELGCGVIVAEHPTQVDIMDKITGVQYDERKNRTKEY